MFRRRLIAMALLAATITPAAITSAATPSATVDSTVTYPIYYFSDSTRTVMVGEGAHGCLGGDYMVWGVKTPYYYRGDYEFCW